MHPSGLGYTAPDDARPYGIPLVHDPETQAYAERRKAEGKTPREIKRCLKRYLARRLFKLMESSAVAA